MPREEYKAIAAAEQRVEADGRRWHIPCDAHGLRQRFGRCLTRTFCGIVEFETHLTQIEERARRGMEVEGKER